MENYDKLMLVMAMSIAKERGLPTDLSEVGAKFGQQKVYELFDGANSNIIVIMMQHPEFAEVANRLAGLMLEGEFPPQEVFAEHRERR